MMQVSPTNRSARAALPAVILIIAALCCGIEIAVWAAERGWIGTPRWRSIILQNGAFWSGLLRDWQPNFAAQPVTMFFSYSLLHAGPVHLIGNMGVLFWMGPGLSMRLGQARFAALWTVSAFGGAAAFALFSTSPAPMVGASGALFGLFGADIMLRWQADRDLGRAFLVTLALLALNGVMFIAERGVLAWQAHLGGYLAGLIMIAALKSTRRA